ncbi:hypothetical protein CSB45_10235 [candidate division KSB3 bacterium]|uniref:Transposase IS204/IS1001/IS1096/IS1165 DDE domain-containing protein n=1 Tax=candidate division KSB3 bacterium TaxID=2044937 RepID=A0A2G6E3G6_9BACT|nr:MAG: hypothetical protein CSB45_10235 [candidate division KSB3 bacterium]PIE29207.1 MAG: hypothetical protein CSA57_10390 [candidate division KSB3 bacterium]
MLDKYVEHALSEEDFSDTASLGSDESSIAKGHNDISLFIDVKRRRTIHVSTGKSHETAGDFVEHVEAHGGRAAQVSEVSCDLSPAFIKGVREHFPNTQITFDTGHIVKKIINEAVCYNISVNHSSCCLWSCLRSQEE